MFNPKFLNPVRVFWPQRTGVYCLPASDDSRTGWGTPFNDAEGNPINAPLGTPGGGSPFVRLYRRFTDLLTLLINRKQSTPYPEESYDWRGLESTPGKGDMPFMIFGGPRTRYFPTYEPGQALSPTEETTDSHYLTHFWYKGKQIEGPGDLLKGGCVYDQNGAEPYFIAVTGANRSFYFSGSGISFWKRRVRDVDQIGWELIDTISDTGQIYLPPECYTDPGCGFFPTIGTWNVPWHFNANGNLAVTTIALPSGGAGAAFGAEYSGALNMKVQVTLSSVTIVEVAQDGTPLVSTTTRTLVGPPGGCGASGTFRTRDQTRSVWGGLITRDFEWPNDNLVDLRIQYPGQAIYTEWCSTGLQFGGYTTRNKIGTLQYSVGAQTYTYTEDTSAYRVDEDGTGATCTTGCVNSNLELGAHPVGSVLYNIGRAGNGWMQLIWGADLRFRALGLQLALLGLRGFTIGGSQPCNCYDNDNIFYASSASAGLGGYFWPWLQVTHRMVLFRPSGITTFDKEDDRRAMAGFGSEPAEGFPWQDSPELTFPTAFDSSSTTYFNTYNYTLARAECFKQAHPAVCTGNIAVDRFGGIFHSFEFSTGWSGAFRFDFTNIGPAFRYLETHLEYDTNYEYEGFDVDTVVGTTGDRKRYHPIQST